MTLETARIERLHAIASKDAPQCPPYDSKIDALVEQSLRYLESDEAHESVRIDAYWPKWDSPWWHMLLLHEMGLTSRIPEAIVEAITSALGKHYLKFFPFTEEEVPSGVDPLNQVACHCQLGTMHQLLTTYGIDVDSRLPWLRPWYLRYQLQDGGLNCDEAAYTRAVQKSSLVSTLPPLEAMLASKDPAPDEVAYLDCGAKYLIEKKLWRSSSTGKPIDKDWLELCFPRFYHYDVLRGLSFLLAWARRSAKSLPLEAVAECIEHIDNQFPDGRIRIQRIAWAGANTRYFDRSTGVWSKRPAQSHSLLQAMSQVGAISHTLTQDWSDARANLLAIIDAGLIEENTPSDFARIHLK